jgi:hypothetical protein
MLLPEVVLGLRPLADGWSRFEAAPRLGDLEWASAVVPVPGGGEIFVVASADGWTRVDLPTGTALVRDGVIHPGPERLTWA